MGWQAEIVAGYDSCKSNPRWFPTPKEAVIRTFVVGLVGAVALTAGLVLLRQQRQEGVQGLKEVPAGETVPGTISLEELRKQGF